MVVCSARIILELSQQTILRSGLESRPVSWLTSLVIPPLIRHGILFWSRSYGFVAIISGISTSWIPNWNDAEHVERAPRKWTSVRSARTSTRLNGWLPHLHLTWFPSALLLLHCITALYSMLCLPSYLKLLQILTMFLCLIAQQPHTIRDTSVWSFEEWILHPCQDHCN